MTLEVGYSSGIRSAVGLAVISFHSILNGFFERGPADVRLHSIYSFNGSDVVYLTQLSQLYYLALGVTYGTPRLRATVRNAVSSLTIASSIS